MTVSATTFIAGTLIGETLLDIPVLGVINRVHITNSLGDVETVYNFGLIDKPEELVVAMEIAEQFWIASQGQAALPPDTPSGPVGPGGGSGPGDGTGLDDGSGGGHDRDPPCDQCEPCQWVTHPDAPPMTEACCDCYKDHADRVANCQSDFKFDAGVCVGGGLVGALVGKVRLCLPLCAAGPYLCAACLVGTSAAALGGIALCLYRASRTRNTCIGNSAAILALCQAVHCN